MTVQPRPTPRRLRGRSAAVVVPISATRESREPSSPARRARTRTLRVAVLHGVGFFYSGGGEKLVIQQVLGLRARGHVVDCYAPIVDAKRSFPVPDALAIIAMSVAAPLLARRLREYDVVLAANQPAGWVAWWARRLHGVPYVLYLAQPNRLLYPRAIDRERTVVVKPDYLFLRAIAPFIRPLVHWADRQSVAGAREALANGRYMTRVLSQLYGRPFRSSPAGAEIVIGNAERFVGELRVNGTTIPKPFILLTNRHYPQKRFEVAIEALTHPKLAARGVRLVITGQETPYTTQLRALVARLGLAKRVRFVGLTSEEDLARLYAAAACYVYPSPHEDYGMGVVEAMAAGTPVGGRHDRLSRGAGTRGYLRRPHRAPGVRRVPLAPPGAPRAGARARWLQPERAHRCTR